MRGYSISTFTKGKGYHKIAFKLNDRKIPSQKGGRWPQTRSVHSSTKNCTLTVRYGTCRFISENAHPALMSKELFEICQENAKKRHNGGGETNKPFDTKTISPFWLRGVMVATSMIPKWLENSGSTRTKNGG
ncbi:recombinase family protein [Paenibacillus larvae]|uniref:Recombinase family protein n=1 Tax=Paenibacillus larvae TaxID=1464 RepID=A0AAP5JSP7_9BACL|nr:hypothetical protein BXP28_18500 [Paenibacillus larvae subsp. larvae]ETK29338.1 hypothetical protein ERIC1_1c28800 [Paenibacillus larvae subsp. larvae DSM 25719]MCY9688240.1 recombinase family protein [Paenibacillus larvae]MDT2251240.1 recombinase family protein [Paenibacillus larvae]